MRKFVIDRLEGAYAVLESDAREFTQVPRSSLPPGAKEGDVLTEKAGKFSPDPHETACRRARIRKKMNALWEETE